MGITRRKKSAVLIFVICASFALLSGVERISVKSDSDPNYLPYSLESIRSGHYNVRSYPIKRCSAVIKPRQDASDTAYYIRAYNSSSHTSDPAIFSLYAFPPNDLIDDDPVKMIVTDWRIIPAEQLDRTIIFGVGFRGDSVYAFKVYPFSDEQEIVYLRPNCPEPGAENWLPGIGIILTEDYDFDGEVEAIIYFNSSRWGPTRELICMEVNSLRPEWTLPMAATLDCRRIFNCRDSLNPGVIIASYNPKQGVSDSNFSDLYGYLTRVDKKGRIVFNYVMTDHHGRNLMVRAAGTPDRYYLYHELDFLTEPPLDTISHERHFLSMINGDGETVRRINLADRVVDMWIMDYPGHPYVGPVLWIKYINARLEVYDSNLELIGWNEHANLLKYFGRLALATEKDSVLIFRDGLYSSDLSKIADFEKNAGFVDVLETDSIGNVTVLLIDSEGEYNIVNIYRKDLWDIVSIAYINNKAWVFTILTALLVALIIISINRYRMRGNMKLIAAQKLALERAHGQLNTTLNALPDFLLELDKNGYIHLLRAPRPEIFPYSPRQAIGKNLSDIMPLNAARTILKAMDSIDETGRAAGQVFCLDTAEETHWFEISLASKGDPGRPNQRFIILARDITERKKIEEKLRRSEDIARVLMNATNDVALMVDRECLIIAINDAAARALGISHIDVIGRNIFDFMPSCFIENRRRVMKEVIESGHYIRYEESGDGKTLYSSVFPILDKSGMVERLAIYSQNISERKELEEKLRLSEEIARTMINTSRNVIILLDNKGNILATNEAALKDGGYRSEEVIGDYVFKFLPPDIAEGRKRYFQKVLESGEPIHFQEDLGDIIRTNHVYPILDEAGNVEQVAVYSQDNTESVRMQEALRESEEKYRTYQENLPVGAFRTSLDGRLLSANNALLRLFAIDNDISKFNVIEAYVSPEDRARVIEITKRDGALTDYEIILKRTDGVEKWYSMNTRPIYDDSGEILYFDGTLVDITTRKKAEEALRQSEEKYRSLLENLPIGSFRATPEGIVTSINPAGLKLLGLDSYEQMIGKTTHGFYANAEQRRAFYEIITRDGKIDDFETEAILRDGRMVWLSISATLIKDEEDQLKYMDGTFQDVSARKEVEAALRESELKYRSLHDNVPVSVFRTTVGGHIISLNKATWEMMGYPGEGNDSSNVNILDVYARPAQRQELLGMLRQKGAVKNFVVEVIRNDGEKRFLSLSVKAIMDNAGNVQYLDGIAEDITDRKKAEENLKQAHEALKRAQAIIVAQEKYKQAQDIAGGLAHEIHNALCPAMNALDILNRRNNRKVKADAERLEELITLSSRAIDRAAGITQLVTTYTRLESERRDEPTVLNQILEEIIEQNQLCIAALGVEVQLDIPDGVKIFANREHLYSLFNNLFLNSLDEFENISARQIKITARKDDSYLIIEHYDNGRGIDEKLRDRIFDLFYSTKPSTGTGIGLALVKRITEIYDARIEVESRVDNYTRFTILWPMAEQLNKRGD